MNNSLCLAFLTVKFRPVRMEQQPGTPDGVLSSVVNAGVSSEHSIRGVVPRAAPLCSSTRSKAAC